MDKKTMLIKLGVTLRDIRKSKNLSQEELSIKCNLHRTYIGMVERGEKNITITSLIKITDALGIDLIYFFKSFDER